MIKLKDILTMDALKYTLKVPADHKKFLNDYDDGMFEGFDISQFHASPPIRNSSPLALRELRMLETIVSTIDINKADDITEYFKEYFKNAGLKYPEDEVSSLIKDSKGIIYKLKYHYNRPRPVQLADAMGLKFHDEPLETAKTPSYPSGHSAQGRLVGKYLATMYPEHSEEIMKLADNISNSRLVAKVHYPSDSAFGLKIGDAMFKYVIGRLR